MLGDNSVMAPPDSMPNSEVKRNSADGSVGFPHVRVGHRQACHFYNCSGQVIPDNTLGCFSALAGATP